MPENHSKWTRAANFRESSKYHLAIKRKKTNMTGLARAIGLCQLFLLLSFCLSGNLSFGNNGSLEQSELLYSTVFTTQPPPVFDREVLTIRNIVIDFNNTEGLPLNASYLADEHLRDGAFYVQLGREFSMVISISYDAIPITQAEYQTDEVCGQFVNLFNVNLSILEKRHWVDNKTNYVTVYRTLGTFSDNPKNILELAKYAPKDGFGKLITKDFVGLYSPGSSNTGLLHLEYRVFKNSGRALWEFFLEFSDGRTLNERDIDIDLNKLLANSELIEPLASRSSSIIIEFHKTQYAGSKTYTMSLQSISPEPSKKEGEENIRITYNLTGPIDNVVAVFSLQKIQEYDWVSIAAIAIVVVLIIASVLIAVKKLRKPKTPSPLIKKKRSQFSFLFHGHNLAKTSRSQRVAPVLSRQQDLYNSQDNLYGTVRVSAR